MAKTLRTWIDTDVQQIKDSSIKWLSECYFFRDPVRAYYLDPAYFFAPADGIIIYQRIVQPEAGIVEIKGKPYTLREAIQDPSYAHRESLVIGIFLTFYDVHINRIPLGGYLSYKQIDKIQSLNRPMLDIEKSLLSDLRVSADQADYLFYNERVLNTIYAPAIQQNYYVLQVADYDVAVIVPYTLKQHQPFFQNRRFSQIRYGSQVDLIVPLSERYDFQLLQTEGMHVEAGVDPLIKVNAKANTG